jgi:hypothetical protein
MQAVERSRGLSVSSALGTAVVSLAGFLLLSMGGAVVAAPATVPLLVLVARLHGRRAVRWAALCLAAATVAEVAWAVTYVTVGEARPAVWLAPLCAAGASAALIAALARHRGAR